MPARKTASVPEAIIETAEEVIAAPVRAAKRASIRPKHGKRLARLIPAALILVALLSAYYFYAKYAALARDPGIVAQQEAQELVEEVGKLIVLPDEEPTVATVSDADLIRDQKFFQGAENGDKLLAYPVAMQAILYRPSAHKIIAVAPIVIGAEGE